jgi:hypothetical protein
LSYRKISPPGRRRREHVLITIGDVRVIVGGLYGKEPHPGEAVAGIPGQ